MRLSNHPIRSFISRVNNHMRMRSLYFSLPLSVSFLSRIHPPFSDCVVHSHRSRLGGVSKQKKGGLSVRTDLSFPPYKAKLYFHHTPPPAFFVTVGLALKHSGIMIQQGTGKGTGSTQALSESCQQSQPFQTQVKPSCRS